MRYLEDFSAEQVISFGSVVVTEADVVGFARQFDPQVFHLEPEAPLTREMGGLLASGWQTTAIFMRLAVEAYLADSAILMSPGVDQVRWLHPVRPGDEISGEAVVSEVRPSRSRPDRGILSTKVRLWNQHREDVLTLTAHAFVRRAYRG